MMSSPWKLRTALAASIVVAGYGARHQLRTLEAAKAAPAATVGSAPQSILPAPADAKRILNATLRHREWANVPAGGRSMLAWVVYPDRSNRAPAVILTGEANGPSDWLRATSDQLAAEGFIAVAPQGAAASAAAAAVRQYASALPS